MINVAIAEDDFRIASIHEQFLEKVEGVRVVNKALNASQMIDQLAKGETDLILLDNFMPDECGASLLPLIRERFPEVDIIMITAATEKEVVEVALKYGVVDYLIKPVTFERFQHAIKTYLNRKAFIQDNDSYNQAVIDQFFHRKGWKEKEIQKDSHPKGIDQLTLEKVEGLLDNDYQDGWTAEQMGEQMGASRTTARRYLEYMISLEKVKAELEYGMVGRPERKYYRIGN
ncbi:response regulator [Sutcliffiella horikoshii]|uniref:Response regulator n=1 Tax=Sutcliffiella horikoshii TaxID=79883 RepID=A0A5D4T508_9BACI|nr:response regulator [Sutcliffiella horikoshii]TYS70379.1 response regulator [Sutcliffiella horikoshii]